MLVGISEAIRLLLILWNIFLLIIMNPNKKNEELNKFNEWLAGLIDGKGQIFVSKKSYANFKFVLPEKDKSILYEIKHKYGGSIKNISGSNSFKYII